MMALAELLPSAADAWPVILLKIILLMLFAALGLAFAVWVALRRDPWIGLRTRHPQPDPLSEVHGDIPRLDFLSAPAPPRKRPSSSTALGASKAGGRVIPSDAPAGRSRGQGGADV